MLTKTGGKVERLDTPEWKSQNLNAHGLGVQLRQCSTSNSQSKQKFKKKKKNVFHTRTLMWFSCATNWPPRAKVSTICRDKLV